MPLNRWRAWRTRRSYTQYERDERRATVLVLVAAFVMYVAPVLLVAYWLVSDVL